jgi:hypothetical protein
VFEQAKREQWESSGQSRSSAREFLQWLSAQPVCDAQPVSAFLTAGSVCYWDLLAPSLALYAMPAATNESESAGGRRNGWFHQHLRAWKSAAWLVWPHIQSRWASQRLRSQAGNGCWSGSGWFLFGCFEPRQARSLLPVVEELGRWGAGNSGWLFSAGAPLAEWLPHVPSGARLLPVETVSNPRVRAQAAAMHREIVRRSQRLLNSARFRQIVQDGLGQAHAAESFIREFRIWLRSYLGRLSYQAAYAEQIFHRLSPRAFVAADDTDPIERVYFAQARRSGVPSLVVQYGSAGENGVNWSFLLAQRAAVFGQASRRLLLEQGVSPERIAITGNPRFDNLCRDLPGSRLRVRSQLGLPTLRRVVLFTSQVNLASLLDGASGTLSEVQYHWLLDTVYELAGLIPETVLIVKLHPDEDDAPHRRRIKALGPRAQGVILCRRGVEVSELIKASDVVITYNSTTGLEALIAGVPLVSVSPPTKRSGYARRGVAASASSRQELQDTLVRILADPSSHRVSRTRTIDKYLAEESAFLGESRHRVCNLIREMAGCESRSQGLARGRPLRAER